MIRMRTLCSAWRTAFRSKETFFSSRRNLNLIEFRLKALPQRIRDLLFVLNDQNAHAVLRLENRFPIGRNLLLQSPQSQPHRVPPEGLAAAHSRPSFRPQ